MEDTGAKFLIIPNVLLMTPPEHIREYHQPGPGSGDGANR